jgi:hypothetical protein
MRTASGLQKIRPVKVSEARQMLFDRSDIDERQI